MSIKGGTEEDIQARIGKAQAAFAVLNKIWRSKEIRMKTKLKIFNSNVKAVLLYGSETWKTTDALQKKIQSFINRCMRRILGIWWPNRIRNEDLWERTGQEKIQNQIAIRKWRWIGHTLRKPTDNITRQALRWNPQGNSSGVATGGMGGSGPPLLFRPLLRFAQIRWEEFYIWGVPCMYIVTFYCSPAKKNCSDPPLFLGWLRHRATGPEEDQKTPGEDSWTKRWKQRALTGRDSKNWPDRGRWREVVSGLCSARNEKD